MPFNVGPVEFLFVLAFFVGMVYVVARVWRFANQGHESEHLQADPQIMRELEEVQTRLVDLEERMDSQERLSADQRQQHRYRQQETEIPACSIKPSC